MESSYSLVVEIGSCFLPGLVFRKRKYNVMFRFSFVIDGTQIN